MNWKNTGDRMPIAIIVHGGAWNIPDELVEGHRKGCSEAALTGYGILEGGGSALDAVEAAAKVMEDDPTFDAGIGSFLTAEGEVELDAIIMDGRNLDAGAVASVRNIRYPISLARRVMEETEHVMFVGEGANKFAEKCGFEYFPKEKLVVERELERWERYRKEGFKGTRSAFVKDQTDGTVGAVAIDAKGNIAVATTTGGPPFKIPGRVGDSPLIGCGAYADNETGGASATGLGEPLMKILMSKTACDFMCQGMSAQQAADASVKFLEKKVNGLGGVITIDTSGEVGLAFNTPRMAYAYIREGENPAVGI